MLLEVPKVSRHCHSQAHRQAACESESCLMRSPPHEDQRHQIKGQRKRPAAASPIAIASAIEGERTCVARLVPPGGLRGRASTPVLPRPGPSSASLQLRNAERDGAEFTIELRFERALIHIEAKQKYASICVTMFCTSFAQRLPFFTHSFQPQFDLV